MRVLVIGAGGFVGHHLMERLRRQTPPIEAIASARNGPDGIDVTRFETITSVLRRHRPSHVVLLAGEASVAACEAEPERAMAANTAGAFAVGRAIVETDPSCALLFVSSGEVYGRSFDGCHPADETTLPSPSGVYAATKLAAEALLQGLVARGLRLLVARPFAHIGPGQSSRFALPSFARRIAEIEAGLAEPKVLTGRLDPVRDYLDVRDVCDAYVALLRLTERLASGEVFNVASGQGRPVGELLRMLLAAAHRPIATEVDPRRVRPTDLPWCVGSAGKLVAATGWRPTIPLEQTVRDIVGWERARLLRASGQTAAS